MGFKCSTNVSSEEWLQDFSRKPEEDTTFQTWASMER